MTDISSNPFHMDPEGIRQIRQALGLPKPPEIALPGPGTVTGSDDVTVSLADDAVWALLRSELPGPEVLEGHA